jgi:parallel beta-helix repeat protein
VVSVRLKTRSCAVLVVNAMLAFYIVAAVVPPADAQDCRGVDVDPGDNIQALIDRHNRHTTFCFRRGVYELSGTIWTGRKYPRLNLRSGAIVDGQGGGFVGIDGDDARDDERGTMVLGGVFQNFGNENAPIWLSPVIVRGNWVVKGTEFRRNFNTGLLVQGDNARVSNVDTHHNGRYGIAVSAPCTGCRAPNGVIIERSEIAYNNTRQLATLDDAGGTKFAGGPSGMIVRNNDVHHNYGSGLWWDTNSEDARIYGNVIHDNRQWGILWEASYGGTKIHHNRLIDNGVGDGTENWGANVQLLVSNSDGSVGGGIEIYENRIVGTAIAVGLLNHTEGMPGTRQVHIHDNTMALRAETTRVGGVLHFGDPSLFDRASGNRFERNTYLVRDRGGTYWKWDGQTLTWQQWNATGHDNEGSLRLIA